MSIPLAQKRVIRTQFWSLLLTVLLLATQLPLRAQQQAREENRPRRVQPEWKTTVPGSEGITTRIDSRMPEPKVRVALATDARSAIISTSGRLLNASGGGTTLIALNTSRVRLEPRLLSPLTVNPDQDLFQLVVAASLSREEAEQAAREIRKLLGKEAQLTFDTETKEWGLLLGGRLSQEEGEELLARLDDSGFDASLKALGTGTAAPTEPPADTQEKNSNRVRLASRPSFPSRELVATSSASRFSSSGPLSFASDNEQNTPVRFNDRPYRGRLEVFTNLRGSLTVVNELGLEDYVRGVVANELSPGGYPAIEAQKAQAIAARTYALRNLGQFRSQGFDLLPTTRSQVYRGLISENSLSTRAVDETRGLVASYHGEPINALYTSTCGGRTEDSENIFNDPIPYLRGHECAAETKGAFMQFTLKTSREPADVRDEENISITRAVALLAVENFGSLRTRVSDSWLEADAPVSEVRSWLASVARLARQVAPPVTEEVNYPAAFATALNASIFGEGRASTLLNSADVEYFLAVRDAAEIPPTNRADLALLLRDGHLSIYPDATLRPTRALSRKRVLQTIVRLLEARSLLQVQKATTRPAFGERLVVRSGRGKELVMKVSSDAFLFRHIGDGIYPVRSMVLVGGESVVFHLNSNGDVDYLEVRPAQNGAAADRFSPFAYWSRDLSLGQIQSRLGRRAAGIGSIVDLRVATRGFSRRVTDLEIIGTGGIAHLRGGRIRSALGLREQLFVIDRSYDDSGRVIGFTFTGRGWGHGVGMCQVGAYGLARQGWTYEQILKTYYTDIEVTKLY
jgi:stage II sporulation protein D